MDNDIILYDWLTFSVKCSEPEPVVTLLGLDALNWEVIKGALGYKWRLYYNKLSIHYDGGNPNMGVCCEMSGQGCRTWESLTDISGGWSELFQRLDDADAHISRLDVAFDDHSGVLDLDLLIDDTRKQSYVSRSDNWQITLSNKGNSVLIGSRQSDILIRIYDKAMERNCEAGTHWNRVEIQLRNDRATKFSLLDVPLGEAYRGVLLNYLRYVIPSEGDANRWRWPMTDYWQRLVDTAGRISLYTAPGMEYNYDQLRNNVVNRWGNAIDALIQIDGEDAVIKAVNDRTVRRNPKYDRVVKDALSMPNVIKG